MLVSIPTDYLLEQPFTAIVIAGNNGNDQFTIDGELTLPATVTESDGNNVIQLGGGNNAVTVGKGKNSIRAGDGSNVVVVGNGT
ncbi:MAG: hypothetical protein ACYC61_32375, partial [Isosphaeraceae bacterium]